MSRDIIQDVSSLTDWGRSPSVRRDGAPLAAQPNLVMSPGRIVLFLGIAILFVTMASLAGQIARYHFGLPTLFGLVDLFYIDTEVNLPTLFQVLHLLLAATLLCIVGVYERRADSRYARYWFILAAGFLLMVIDEGAQLHERIPLHRFIETEGAWNSLWIFPGIVIVGVIALYFRSFLSQMQLKDSLQIGAAGTVFVSGAIGVETAISAAFDTTEADWKLSFQYVVMVHIEEFLEMTGVLMFNRFLLYRIAGLPPLSLAMRSP